MSPPVPRPFPRFIADSPQEGKPYGRFEERLRERFVKACDPHGGEAGARLDPETIKWFPDRGWGGRVYVPATGRAVEPVATQSGDGEENPGSSPVEYFGWISFERPEDGEPGGDITLVWGLPLVRGASAVTAELDDEVLDQAAVQDGRFTLDTVDA